MSVLKAQTAAATQSHSTTSLRIIRLVNNNALATLLKDHTADVTPLRSIWTHFLPSPPILQNKWLVWVCIFLKSALGHSGVIHLYLVEAVKLLKWGVLKSPCLCVQGL